jgi:prepilin-type processing-associated H-X9-DG protein
MNDANPGAVLDLLASRHDRKNARANSKLSNPGWGRTEGNAEAMGNVGFCDGHVGTLGRREALRGRHTGNPNPDPDAAHGFGL